MSIFIQEVLGLLNRNQKKVTLDKAKDWFEFGKLYSTSSLNNKSGYTPRMDPFVIKWGDFICQATEDMTRTLPGQGNLGFIPVYTDPSGSCNWDTLKDSIITQNALNTIINIAGSLQVLGDVQISGGDLTATTSTFNLLNTAPVSFINFGGSSSVIEMSNAGGIVNINGTAQSTSCTTGALIVKGGVGIAKNLYVCNDVNVTGDVAINGGDLTSTATTFNLLGQSTNINFGSNSQNIIVGSANSTSDVTIIGTQESTSCTTGALVINGGVGIAKNLNLCGILSINNTTESGNCNTGALVIAGGVGIAKNVNICGDLTVQGRTYLNGNVNLGNAITDDIRLYGQLIDNYGNGPLPNQVLVGQAGGLVLWQNDDVVETLTYGSIWVGNSSNLKQELPIGTTGSILVSTGSTLSYQFITANNGLTMSTPLNSQLGGTLIQGTIIQTQTFDLKLEGTSSIPILNVNQLGTGSGSVAIKGTSAGGFGGYFQGTGSALGAVYANNSGSTPTTTFDQSNGQVVSKFTRSGSNNTGINTILDLYNICNTGPAIVGLGTAVNFNIEDSASTPSYAGNISFDWTSFTGGNTSKFNIVTVNQGVASNKVEIAGSGQLKLNKYGLNTFTGTPAYYLAVTSSGDIIETTGGSGSSVTANNGLVINGANNVQLGGTLLQNTLIDGGAAAGNSLTLTNSDLIIQNGAGSGGARGNIILSNNRMLYWGSTSGPFISGSSLSMSYFQPTLTNKHEFNANMRFSNYGTGAKTGTVAYLLAVSPTGDVIETTAAGSGTVTNVSALYIQTTGTDITSSVDFPTTTPIIRLNIPTASAVNRGALSAADWITFNSKQGAITLTTTGSSGAATLIGNVLNIPQYSGGSTPTNLSTSQSATNFTINSDTGTDAIVPLGNGTLAGATLNNYTTAEQTKLAGIAAGAEVNVNADWNATSGDAQILNKPTIFAEPGIFSGGGNPTLAAGVTALEVRTLIGAGTPIVDEDFVKNTADIYPETQKVTQIITLSQAQYDAIAVPLDSTLYIIV